MKFPTHFVRDPHKGIEFKDKTLCQQHLKMATDINSLIQRVVAGDHTAIAHGVYADVSGMPEDFTDASNRCAYARSLWHDLPEQVKASYGSPEAFVNAFDAVVAKQSETPSPSESPSSSVSEKSETAPSAGASTRSDT